MRRVESSSRYTVQISPSAWRQIAQLPADVYRHVREELDAITARAAADSSLKAGAPRGKEAASALALIVDDYVVLYDVDAERRSVVLLEVARRQFDDE
jgi:mRNA-degrading endonuclease RelE of RelBE toxin-antitoxin system